VEYQPARLIKKDEQVVQDLVAVLEDFNSDPFDDIFQRSEVCKPELLSHQIYYKILIQL